MVTMMVSVSVIMGIGQPPAPWKSAPWMAKSTPTSTGLVGTVMTLVTLKNAVFHSWPMVQVQTGVGKRFRPRPMTGVPIVAARVVVIVPPGTGAPLVAIVVGPQPCVMR